MQRSKPPSGWASVNHAPPVPGGRVGQRNAYILGWSRKALVHISQTQSIGALQVQEDVRNSFVGLIAEVAGAVVKPSSSKQSVPSPVPILN
jgi:hypothetical protein